jgi:hypothetical protein
MGKTDFKVGRKSLDYAVRLYKRGDTSLLPGIQECFAIFRPMWGKHLAGGKRQYDSLLMAALKHFRPYTKRNRDTDLLGSRFNEYFVACVLNKCKAQIMRRRAAMNHPR